MIRTIRSLVLLAGLTATTGCATIAGTAFSPITGGVDLVVQTQSQKTWPLWIPVFVGGAVAVVADGYTDSQRSLRTTLAGLPGAVSAAGIRPPAVWVVGEVVSLGTSSAATSAVCRDSA